MANTSLSGSAWCVLLVSTVRPLGGSSQGKARQVEQAGGGKVVLSVMVALMRSARRHTVPPRRVRSPKNFCKSDDIISSVIHIIRRLRIAVQRDRMISSSRSMLYRFLILYGLLYAGFGVQSPYLPILLDNRHLRPETIALAWPLVWRCG